MIKHFVIELVAILALPTALSGIAFAHDQPREFETPADSPSRVRESGLATYYGSAHHGRRTADGSRFDKMALTAAHPWLPFGTKVRVTLASTGRTVVVTITDRLHARRSIVDLSLAAALQIGMVGQGIALVTLTPG